MGKGKKNRKQDDDWENDLDEIAKEAGIDLPKENEEVVDIPQPTKKEKKKKKGKAKEDKDDENDEEVATDSIAGSSKKAKPSFSSLMIDDVDEEDNDDGESGNESPVEKIEQTQVAAQKGKKNKKDKKKGKVKQEEEDIAEILNELELNNTKEKSSKKSKKKKKKEQDLDDLYAENEEPVQQKQEEETVKSEGETPETTVSIEKNEESTKANEEDNEDDDSGMKTAAQKRAEKKEREKKKKEAERKKAAKKKKKAAATEDNAEAEEPSEDVSDKKDDQTNTEAEKDDGKEPVDEAAESGDEETKDKKKKKKKKKKGEEEEKKKTKKPGKAAILRMQEALEEVKREEERLRLEAEAKAKAEEEAEEARLEKIRLEKEKKEKKKQKEKERVARLKKEGKFMTQAQKEQKRKAEAMLAAMKQQGISIPTKEDAIAQKPKRPNYGKKKKPNQKNQQQPENEETKVEENKVEDVKSIETPTVEDDKKEKEGEIVDSWDADDKEDVADSWDTEEIKVKGKVAPKKVAGKKTLEKQISSKSTGEEVEDDDDQEEDDESEEESSDDEEESDEESSEEESESEEESGSEDEKKLTPERIKERARDKIEMRKLANENNRSTDVLRAPVVCVLGHVDTGKTKILDKIRRTNVQDGEAGGITQQIGATNIPVDKVREQTKMIKKFKEYDLKLPGLLIIDTPGHESFSNLRSRGSNLCDMAILVVDIMHGLEQQTIESINLLKRKQTPFVVALNKIDRLFEWKKNPNSEVEETIKNQGRMTKQEFDERSNIVINQFAEQGLNAALHYKNQDEKSYISLVPTSAHSGDGMGDLMAIICRLTQTRLAKKLAYSEELQSTVMEVKALPGLGTTIDVILVNGKLKEGDTIVTGGIDGAIVTQIRSVLTPQPMRELRVKAQYIHHQCLKAAQGAKLCGKDLDKVLAGSPVFVAHHPDEVEVLKEDVEDFVSSSLKAIKVSERGVYVQASTLGSLEALLEFLKTSKIPYCGVNIGPVHKRDIMKCSVMLEHEPMHAVVLAFDVKVERDAQEYADKEGIKIFTAEIIYHLFDKFTAYCEEYKEKQREKFKHLAVYPCKLKVLPEHIFNTRDPIVLGVNVEAGTLRIGTPIIVPGKDRVMIGFATGIEANHKQLEKATTGQEVCVKIDSVPGEAPKLYGRHFTHEDMLCSRITRDSIDVMKQYFRDDMAKSDWQLIIELKKLLDIM